MGIAPNYQASRFWTDLVAAELSPGYEKLLQREPIHICGTWFSLQ
jgi:hypothetical protein